MGHKHTRDDILAGALEAALADGLSQVSYGRVARHLGISDRVVVYYFPTVASLVGEIMLVLGSRLQATLVGAVGSPVADHRALLRVAWPVLTDPEVDRIFALYLEAAGLAAAGRAPYVELAPRLTEAWIDWAAGHLSGQPRKRRIEAEAAIAVIDGLLLLRQLAGREAADRAAHRLGAEPA